MTNPNTAPSAAQPYAIDGVVYAIARKDQREAYVMFDTPAQANGFVEYMRRFIEKPVPAQTGGEAVAPEAKPEWPKGAFFTDGEGNFYDEQAEPLDHAFAPPAPPAPPAPLPGKRERALFQAWARDRHWNLSLRADGERYMSESTQEGWYAWKGRAALSAQAAPADYPPPSDVVSKEKALEHLDYLHEAYGICADWEPLADIRRFIEQSGRSGVSADPLPLDQSQVEWVVNDIAELGVKIGQQFFWLYKGDSLVYGKQPDEQAQGVVLNHDTDPPKVMHWRPVFKREFGECCHPVNYADLRVCGHPHRIGTVSLDDSDEWKPIPAAQQHQVKKGEPS